MADPGWTRPESPFHEGEQLIQERLGIRAKLEAQGRRMMRDYMPEQHRQFFAQLPFVLVGSLDEAGRPWASILTGAPGFLSSPDPRRLLVQATPLVADPLAETLTEGAPIGLLGIELHSRRRNRMNGRIARVAPGSFEVAVDQSFGNCPQYIQTRAVAPAAEGPAPSPRVHRAEGLGLGEEERRRIAAADTFFIASATEHGVDVSHRGGKPGFVRIDPDGALTVPDYLGNSCFNTLGNLLRNPRAGLLFIDFDRGDLLYLTGATELLWDDAEVKAFQGAERAFRFRTAQAIRVEGALPLRGAFEAYSPALERTGSWEQAAETLAASAPPGG